MDEIIFSDDPTVSSADAIVIEVPTGVESKEELLTVFGDVLEEAGISFGHNWDALYDVLTDMSYLTDIANQIVIVHADMPLKDNDDDFAQYIGVLGDALDLHRKKMKRRAPLEVYFPESARDRVRAV